MSELIEAIVNRQLFEMYVQPIIRAEAIKLLSEGKRAQAIALLKLGA